MERKKHENKKVSEKTAIMAEYTKRNLNSLTKKTSEVNL